MNKYQKKQENILKNSRGGGKRQAHVVVEEEVGIERGDGLRQQRHGERHEVVVLEQRPQELELAQPRVRVPHARDVIPHLFYFIIIINNNK